MSLMLLTFPCSQLRQIWGLRSLASVPFNHIYPFITVRQWTKGKAESEISVLPFFPIRAPGTQLSRLKQIAPSVHIYTSIRQTHVTERCEVCPLQLAVEQEEDLISFEVNKMPAYIKRKQWGEIHSCVLKVSRHPQLCSTCTEYPIWAWIGRCCHGVDTNSFN